MKRSEINSIIEEAKDYCNKNNFKLPPFAFWSVQDWKNKDKEKVDEIITHSLGWDITDFGLGDFKKTGICIFTIRNGSPENLKLGKGKLYAEKVFFLYKNQEVPLHYHWIKVEDVINRAGGAVGVQLYNSTKDDGLDSTIISASIDGEKIDIEAGKEFFLKSGESITLMPGVYHRFWCPDENVLVGEVSLVNDDRNDNKFYEPVGRFPKIDEDEEPIHLLCNEYLNFIDG
tara:strand:- start:157 stop:846 length:690 start_codon:yes stop_codon:yes gene_type:complete